MFARSGSIVVFVLMLPTSLATAQEQPEAAANDAAELKNINTACRLILDSSKADDTAKANAIKWGVCVKTRQWGDVKARYIGMGKNADGAWCVRVQDFKGEKTELLYNKLDPASKQVLKDIWQLKVSIPKCAAKPEIAQELKKAEAAKARVLENARRKRAGLPSIEQEEAQGKQEEAQRKQAEALQKEREQYRQSFANMSPEQRASLKVALPKARAALDALKKIEARTEIGVDYDKFREVFTEQYADVKIFMESPQGNSIPSFSSKVSEATDQYKLAVKDIDFYHRFPAGAAASGWRPNVQTPWSNASGAIKEAAELLLIAEKELDASPKKHSKHAKH